MTTVTVPITQTVTFDVPAAPAGAGGLYKPTSQADFVSYVQAAMDAGQVAVLDPTTVVTLTSPVVLNINYGGGQPFGIKGNGAKLIWGGGLTGDPTQGGTAKNALTFHANVQNRCLIVEGLFLDGGGYSGGQCWYGIVFEAPKNQAIYKATIRDLYVTYCNTANVCLMGDFYESLVDNIQSENCVKGDGLYISDQPSTLNGVISNVMIRSANLSRNGGYGLHLDDNANSVDLCQGSFILNAKGAVFANSGIRNVTAINGENTGLSLINIPASSYQTVLRDCNLSSDGATCAAGGKPSQFLVNSNGVLTHIDQTGGFITFYGAGTNTTAINAPAGTAWS